PRPSSTSATAELPRGNAHARLARRERDVAAMVRARELDLRDTLVRLGARRSEVRTEAHHGQYAAARRDEPAPTDGRVVVARGPTRDRGARVEHVHAVDRLGVGDPRDLVARAHRARVTLRGDDDGHGRLLAPAQRREVGEATRRGRVQQPPEGAEQARQDDLRLGDRKSTRLNSSHVKSSYAVSCLKKKNCAKYSLAF